MIRWRFHSRMVGLGISLASIFALAQGVRAQEVEIYDNEPSKIERQTPEDAARGLRLPDGFSAKLFAGEPDVQQPISLCWDRKGRLWIAENYTYADASTNFDSRLKDRIVIFEDTDGDGKFDNRKVFWDQASKLSSIEVGFGGVWVLATPHLLFIPDANGDDVPDAAPQVVLDGFEDNRVRHNMVNGLRWGPDGWLYARHGIQANSLVGPPNATEAERTTMTCSVWRIHPVTKKYEIVCTGTTNPWGMDWNDHGELFFINTVIGHLWHAVPGAHYERMYGEDLNPHVYQLLPQSADHVHWNIAKEQWAEIRTLGVTPETDRAGGGHAHCGLMFYLGGNWPIEYRDELFTVNFHGRRLNRDHLELRGASFVGLHRPDFAFSSDPWFRGIDLTYGPDGAVYVIDWSDAGECHENDGVHRHSGRIFKIYYGPENPVKGIDLNQLTDEQLAREILNPNDWYVRNARVVLAERAASGADLSKAKSYLTQILADSRQAARIRLRALWALNAAGQAETKQLLGLLESSDAAIRSWAVRLLTDTPTGDTEVIKALTKLASKGQVGIDSLYLASALQRVTGDSWWGFAEAFVTNPELAKDERLALMTWYGLEAHVGENPEKSIALFQATKSPLLRRFIARRITYSLDEQPKATDLVVAELGKTKDAVLVEAGLQGMYDALAGKISAKAPTSWRAVSQELLTRNQEESGQLIQQLSVVFGDGRAVDELFALITDSKANISWRRQAIASLARKKSPGVVDLFKSVLDERELAAAAVDGIASAGSEEDAAMLAQKFGGFYPPAKEAVVRLLASRPSTALLLVKAVSEGRVPRVFVPPGTLRQLQLLGSDELNKKLEEVFPEARLFSSDKLARMNRYRELLTEAKLQAADKGRGRAIFDQSCSKCHKMFGEGSAVGPELTGAQRSNMQYILENVVDPSALVAESFRISIVRLDDGRVLTGVVSPAPGDGLSIQTTEQKVLVPADEIEEVKKSTNSLMPEGLLDVLKDEEVVDLVAYLQSTQQVKAKAK